MIGKTNKNTKKSPQDRPQPGFHVGPTGHRKEYRAKNARPWVSQNNGYARRTKNERDRARTKETYTVNRDRPIKTRAFYQTQKIRPKNPYVNYVRQGYVKDGK